VKMPGDSVRGAARALKRTARAVKTNEPAVREKK
jgi:hypothetical protein